MGRARRRKKAKLMYIKFAFLVIVLIVAISLIRNSIAKYRSTAKSSAEVDLAFYMFKETDISQTLKLESILPREQPYEYTFSVANNDGTDRTETAIHYTIELKTTTNLQLDFKVYNANDMTTDLVESTETRADDDGTYFKYIKVAGGNLGFEQDEQVVYKILVEFPTLYNSAPYEGIVEYVKLTIKSTQRIV